MTSDIRRKVVPRWLRRSLGILLLLVVGTWFARYAYLRLTVMPPVPVEEMFESLPGGEADETGREVEGMLSELGQGVPFTPPDPPAGYEWAGAWSSLEIGDALRGAWEPENRPHLRAVIAYLRDPNTQAVLRRLHELRGQKWSYDEWLILRRSQWPDKDVLIAIRSGVKTLIDDARLQLAGDHAPGAAIEDVRTALWLADGLVRSSTLTLLVSCSCEALTFEEIRHWAQEHDLDREALARLEGILEELRPLPPLWGACMEGEAIVTQCLVDALYTRTPDGNGWYVLSRRSAVEARTQWWNSNPGSEKRTMLWNLCSTFYNDRATVEAKLSAYVKGWSQLPELSYPEARLAAEQLIHGAEAFSPLDGLALDDAESYGPWRAYQLIVAGEAARRATLLTLALERYWLDNGAYPDSLAALVPRYVKSIPPDPFTDEPFRYRSSGTEGYALWSCGYDGEDNGGKVGSAARVDGDLVFTGPRDDAGAEPRLRPVNSAQPNPGSRVPWRGGL